MTNFNSNGHLSEEGLSLYVDGLTLDAVSKVPVDIREHIEQCIQCHSEATELYAVVSQLDPERGAHPTLEPKVKKIAIRRSLIWTVAVAASVAAVILFTYWNSQPKNDTPDIVDEKVEQPSQLPTTPKNEEVRPYEEPQIAETPNEEKIAPVADPKVEEKEEVSSSRELYASNYTINEDLDELVATNYRSDDVEITQPENEKVYTKGQEVNFSWSTNLDEDWTIIILNNKNEEVFRKSQKAKNLSWNIDSVPGLYYWRLESTEELWQVGKFFVE